MSDTSGPRSIAPFAWFDHDTSSLRMSQLTFILDSTPSCVTLPASGSMRSGQLFERPISEHVTSETVCSSLLPTPVVNDMGAGKTPDEWDALKEKWQAKFNNNGHGNSLSIEAQLLPTPVSRDSKGVTLHHKHRGVVSGLPDVTDWGKYAPAIERWAEVMNRPAPDPTDDQKRLNPALVEWMMGYPEGWTEGVSRTGQLKALGNSIVPHQAAAAWGNLLGMQAVPKPVEVKLLPTPAAWDGDRGPDYARADREGSGGDDLVTTVAKMTGGRE